VGKVPFLRDNNKKKSLQERRSTQVSKRGVPKKARGGTKQRLLNGPLGKFENEFSGAVMGKGREYR